MSHITISTEFLAGQIANNMTIVEYAEAAMKGGYSGDFRPAILAAAGVRELTSLALAHVNPKEVHDIERFTEWHVRSKTIIDLFFKQFKIVVLKAENGHAQVAQVEPVVQPRRKPIINNRQIAQRNRTPPLTRDAIGQVLGYFEDFKQAGSRPGWNDFAEIGKSVGKSKSYIYTLWSKWKDGGFKNGAPKN